MKREIRFRGKRVDNGAWETGSFVKKGFESELQYFITDKITGYNSPVVPETVGQFTGIEDKNRKEIYEGDICKTNINEILGIIKWDNHRSCFLCEWTNMPTAGDIEYLVNGCGLEVIGNIHDNPELLKGGNNAQS